MAHPESPRVILHLSLCKHLVFWDLCPIGDPAHLLVQSKIPDKHALLAPAALTEKHSLAVRPWLLPVSSSQQLWPHRSSICHQSQAHLGSDG